MLTIKSLPQRFTKIRRQWMIAAAIIILSASQHATADVTGPIWGDPTLLATTSFNLSDVGYEQKEYFVSGMAKSYTNTKPLTSDGKWTVKAVDQNYFKTRLVVYRPTDPAKFNGTVIVEWFNITGGTEAGAEWIMAHNELIRKGYAWVGVSAQKGGIDGGGINITGLPLHLKLLNLLRYLTLAHPGDKYSYDIFSQVSRAVLKPSASAPNPLSGLQVKRAIAAGESQSADFLLTYVNAIAPLDKLFNGYFIHSRFHGSAGLASPQTSGSSIDFGARSTVRVRDDLGVPVLNLQTETDLFVLGSYPDRQPDSPNFRLWEVAGASHADYYFAKSGQGDRGNDPSVVDIKEDTSAIPVLYTCDKPINAGPQHFVVSAAISALDNWLRNGVAPAYADRLQVAGNPAAIVRDSVGNAIGGIRNPLIDVPIATLSGEGGNGNVCFIYGTTKLFNNSQLMSLYPTHATFTSEVNTSVDNAVLKGFLTPPDGNLIKTWAQGTNIGNY